MIKKLMKYLQKKSTKLKENSTKLILFDIDNTLVRVFSFHEKAFQKVFKKEFNIKASLLDIDPEGKLYIDIFKEVSKVHGIKLSDKKARKMIEAHGKIFVKILPKKLDKYILPGVKKLVKELNKKYTLGVITGNNKKLGEAILKRTSLYKYFKVKGYSGNKVKTRTELVKKVLGKTKNAVIIGDSVNDIKSAKENNVKVIAVNTGFQPMSKLLKQKPNLLVKTLEDKKVLDFIKNE